MSGPRCTCDPGLLAALGHGSFCPAQSGPAAGAPECTCAIETGCTRFGCPVHCPLPPETPSGETPRDDVGAGIAFVTDEHGPYAKCRGCGAATPMGNRLRWQRAQLAAAEERGALRERERVVAYIDTDAMYDGAKLRAAIERGDHAPNDKGAGK